MITFYILYTIIFFYFQIDGNLPDSICLLCIDKLTDIYKFMLQCENSTFLLNQYMQSKTEVYDAKGLIKLETVDSNNTKDFNAYFNDSTSAIEKIKEKKRICRNILLDNDKNLKSFFCSLCNKRFKNNYILTSHNKLHREKEHFFCAICEKKFKSKACLSRHIKEIHRSSKTISEPDFTDINANICNICNKTFKSKYILTVHKKRHVHKGQFLCTTCGKGFNSKGCLNRHTRVHTGEKKYECEVCKKRFPSSNNLNLHSRIHSGIKPYLCTICGKSFTHPTGFTYHVRTHTKEKNYSCEFCGKAFAIQCHLDNHRKIHTGN